MAQENSLFAEVSEHDRGSSRSEQWARVASQWRQTLSEQWGILTDDLLVVAAMGVIGFFTLVAVFAPYIAPFQPTERQYVDDVLIARWKEPAFLGGPDQFLLGTTAQGYDIFSQLVYGTRPALIVGFVAAFLTVGIGTSLGLVAGYYGGYVDDLLMRVVDFAYGLPLLPTVVVLVSVIGPGFTNVLFAIILLQWRASARVIRSQVLSLRERPFVRAARVAGASDWRIITRHIAPNVVPLSFLYAAFAIGWAILTEAGASFLGMGDPNQVSWGTMLQSARAYSALSEGTWWWFVPPGLCIALVVISGFLIGRGYEEVVNPELQVE
jgi:peptide/nickel transport system permease protein